MATDISIRAASPIWLDICYFDASPHLCEMGHSACDNACDTRDFVSDSHEQSLFGARMKQIAIHWY